MAFLERILKRKCSQEIIAKAVTPQPASKQVPDAFEGLYSLGFAIEPPYDPLRLLVLAETNEIHSAALHAVATDAVGRGWLFTPLNDEADAEEKGAVEKLLDDLSPQYTFGELLYQAAWEQLAVGWAAWEVVRDEDGRIGAIYPMPAHTVRLTKDPDIFVQHKSGQFRYFKRFGVEAALNPLTGRWEDADQDASEVIFFSRYSPRSRYGVPHWISCLASIAEYNAIRDYSLAFFESSGTVGRLVILRTDTPEMARTYVDEVTTELYNAVAKYHSTLVLGFPKSVEATVEKLNPDMREGHFLRRREELVKAILMAHSVPPYRVGWAVLGPMSKDTEVLTESGWKPLPDVQVGEHVATLNLLTDRIEFQPVQETHRYYYETMVRMAGEQTYLDILASPDHRMWLAEYTNKRKFHYRWWTAAEVLARKRERPQMDFAVRTGGILEGNGRGLDPDIAALVGWIAAEGSLRYRKGQGYEVTLYQKPGPKADKIDHLLSRIPGAQWSKKIQRVKKHGVYPDGSPRWDVDMICWRLLGDFKRRIGDLMGWRKHLPNALFYSSLEARLRCLDALIDGDGSKQGSQRTYTSADPVLADQVLTLAILSGLGAHLIHRERWCYSPRTGRVLRPIYEVHIAMERFAPQKAIKVVEEVPYHDYAYCLTVPNGTLLYRRNGQSFIAGNSLGGSAAKEMLQAYRHGVIEPIQTVFEDRLNKTLFGSQGLNLQNWCWQLEDLDWEETELTLEVATKAVESGLMTPNEARTELGLEPAEDPAMDAYYYRGQEITEPQLRKTVDVLQELRNALRVAVNGVPSDTRRE